PSLTAKDASGVLLPVDDMAKRILHGPGIPSRRPRHEPLPVRGTESPHDAIELGELAPRPGDDFLARVSHVLRRILSYRRRAPPRNPGARAGELPTLTGHADPEAPIPEGRDAHEGEKPAPIGETDRQQEQPGRDPARGQNAGDDARGDLASRCVRHG